MLAAEWSKPLSSSPGICSPTGWWISTSLSSPALSYQISLYMHLNGIHLPLLFPEEQSAEDISSESVSLTRATPEGVVALEGVTCVPRHWIPEVAGFGK